MKPKHDMLWKGVLETRCLPLVQVVKPNKNSCYETQKGIIYPYAGTPLGNFSFFFGINVGPSLVTRYPSLQRQ